MKHRLFLCVFGALFMVGALLASLQQSGQGAALETPTLDLCVNTTGADGCYTSIQQAINAAPPEGGGVIYVDSGTYSEHIYIDRNLQLLGKGWDYSVIDGNHTGPTTTLGVKWSIDPSTIISGFKIIGGGTGISSTSTNDGGGISMWSASPHMLNIWIDGCTARNGGGVYVSGGAPTFENVTVWNSQAYQRGGGYSIVNEADVRIFGDPLVALHPFQDTVGSIWFNRAAWEGGGIYINNSTSTLNGLRIWYNVSDMTGGGVSLASSSYPIAIYGNLIWLNGAKTIGNAGGGFYTYDVHNMELFLNDISGNIASGAGGAAIFGLTTGNVYLNRFLLNRTSGNNAYAAGVKMWGDQTVINFNHNWMEGNTSTKAGGAMYIDSGAAPRIEANVIVSNSIGSGMGAGILFQDAGEAYVANNIIARNTITTAYGTGSGVSIFLSPVKFINNTVAHNYDGGIYIVDAENSVVQNNIVAFNTGVGLEAPYVLTYTLNANFNDVIGNDTDYTYPGWFKRYQLQPQVLDVRRYA